MLMYIEPPPSPQPVSFPRPVLDIMDPELDRTVADFMGWRGRGLGAVASILKPAKPIAVLGGTFWPPTAGHLVAVLELEAQGYEVWVVPSMGHIFKLGSAGSYELRVKLCRDAFGSKRVHTIESDIWALVGLPVYTYDILAWIRRVVPVGTPIFAVVGQDIDPRTWQGYPEIIAADFGLGSYPFILLKDKPQHIRATGVRTLIEGGAARETWEPYVANQAVADDIQRFGLFLPEPPARPDLTFLA